ncbi:hypothetical protein JL107_10875 [Nakamurella flavida]|uniref:Uncharacterized protein n=1 Tax=Nakamurella flavida TaxID=363630 RepID=A0A938YQ69_9ACTN|nr:hypothetical protein [Nakamurella flavida]MBM9476950.1 hypothetical protein [Nakamurella flavida]MDP9779895.1 hypothetical protein [Nakamurella flavida]
MTGPTAAGAQPVGSPAAPTPVELDAAAADGCPLPGGPAGGRTQTADLDGVDTGDRAVPAPAHRPGPGDWLVVAGLALLAAWVAVVAVFFLPLHIGSVPLPVSALLPVALLAWAPRAAYRLTGRIAAAGLIVVAWFAVSVYLVLVRNELYLNYPVTVFLGQWRVMLLLGLGALTAAATLGLLWGDHLRSGLAARADPARPDPARPDPARPDPPA